MLYPYNLDKEVLLNYKEILNLIISSYNILKASSKLL